jgi:hypothetical protein
VATAIGRTIPCVTGPVAMPANRLHSDGRMPRSAGPLNSLTKRIRAVSGGAGQTGPSTINGSPDGGAAQPATVAMVATVKKYLDNFRILKTPFLKAL